MRKQSITEFYLVSQFDITVHNDHEYLSFPGIRRGLPSFTEFRSLLDLSLCLFMEKQSITEFYLVSVP